MKSSRPLSHRRRIIWWKRSEAIAVCARSFACAAAALGVTLALAPSAVANGRRSTAATGESVVARRAALSMYLHDRSMRPDTPIDAHHAGKVRARTAVVGGVSATAEQVPWQAEVFAEFEVNGSSFYLSCGASIIDMRHLVTAAHCAYDPATGQPLAGEDFVVLVGASSLSVAEIKHGPTVEARFVDGVRIHPDFDYTAGPGTPNDVAVLELAGALKESSGVRALALPSSSMNPLEGASAEVSGFGTEGEEPEIFDEGLHSISLTLDASSGCGGEANALVLCGSSASGTACAGDAGGPLVTTTGGSSTLSGVLSTVAVVEGRRCRDGAVDGFVNVAAPEIKDFIEGSEDPPLAPQGGGAQLTGTPTVQQTLTCAPGNWSNDPTYAYAFINSANGQVLQQGASATYTLGGADVGRTIVCEVQATNSGGTGVARSSALAPVQAAPVPSSPPAGGGSSTTTSTTPTTTATTPTSGVLAYTATGVSSSEIAALLGAEIVPHGKAVAIAAGVKASGFSLAFEALEAGTAVVAWYQLPAGAKLAGNSKAKPVEVAVGQATFSSASVTRLKLKLTSAGRVLLKKHKSLKLTARGVFTPSGGTAVTALKVFTLR